MLGIDSAQTLAERKEADGKAVGGACRHAGRALEDCYALNRKAERAAVFAGWREMNDYMRENNIDAVAPLLNAALAGKPAAAGCRRRRTLAEQPGGQAGGCQAPRILIGRAPSAPAGHAS